MQEKIPAAPKTRKAIREEQRRRAAAVREAHAAAETEEARALAAFEKRTGSPHPLARLSCELGRVLNHSPASLEGEPSPTFAEVAHLLRLAATAIRRYSDEPLAQEAATLVGLAMRALSAPRPKDAQGALHAANERAFDGLRVGLRLTPIGDRIEDDLGHPGHWARAGRALLWAVERCLDRGPPPVDVLHARFIPPLPPGVEITTALLAREIATALLASPYCKGIVDDGSFERIEKAVAGKLEHWPPAAGTTALDAALKAAELREAMAVKVVVAAATASGLKAARRKLFDGRRKTLGRLKPKVRAPPGGLSAPLEGQQKERILKKP